MDTNESSTISVLMLPWLAHGHISPFLELAKALSTRNFFIYLCSTPVNLSSIKQKLTRRNFISIKLVELHLPTFPELPPHYHTTNGLPPHLMPTLQKAFDMSKANFSNIIKILNPDLLIYDFLQPWAPEVASAQNIPAVLFLSPGAASSCYLQFLYKNQSFEFPFPEIYLQDYERIKINSLLGSTANGLRDSDRCLQCIKKSSNIILIKTFREIEGKYFDYLSILNEKRMVPVGPLVQESIIEEEKLEVFEWLSQKDRCSTVFVFFGSEYFLSKDDMEEIAHGLEPSNVNFIWVVRMVYAVSIEFHHSGTLQRYRKTSLMYYKVPGIDLDSGFRLIASDKEVMKMLKDYNGLTIIVTYIERCEKPIEIHSVDGCMLADPKLRVTYGEEPVENDNGEGNINEDRKENGVGIGNENEKCDSNDKEVSADNQKDSDDSDGSWFNENIDYIEFSGDDIFVYCNEEDEEGNYLQKQNQMKGTSVNHKHRIKHRHINRIKHQTSLVVGGWWSETCNDDELKILEAHQMMKIDLITLKLMRLWAW
ncbi:hypothetical protein F0562_032040 [Nyssa sinensis]|uniref:Glycosyltransferase N-terminal domain-containing protein n=1 Tax=Nyssa sinensis TaxID=561372 RepID=A0A5J5AUF6_9ASTE|nr:hypothetical protein F0562_032040 [Nyssa sinensis]